MDIQILENKNEGSNINITERTDSEFPGIKFIDIDIDFKEYTIPKNIKIVWYMPIVNAYGLQNFDALYEKNNPPSWHPRCNYFAGNRYAPFMQLISSDGRNSLTLTLSDAETLSEIKCGVEEPVASEEIILDLFVTPHEKRRKDYHLTVYVDDNDKSYDEAINSVLRFWEEKCGYSYAYTPDDAREPLYSAWYSFHRDQYADKIVEQCKLAREYGMSVVIVDDGWELSEEHHGFQSGGDWEPYLPKVHDMRDFARRIHETGMKMMVWFSPAHCGPYTKAYQRFNDMLTNKGEDITVFDPRYPEVRKYLEEKIADQAIEWGIDGLKLDFIDAIFPENASHPFDEKMDFERINDAVDALLKTITEKVRRYNPDFLIEFRQAYYGPAIRKYGNMLRVSDCPDDSMRNHVAGIWMRQIVGPQSVHSDMLMWHNDDPVESVANQFLCCMFLVPQISVLLDKIPDEHKLALKTFLDFWRNHKKTLLYGKLTADNPLQNYTLVKAENNGEIIAVAHAKPVINLVDFNCLYFFNASDGKKLIVFAEKNFGNVTTEITDCCGKTISENKYVLSEGAHLFNVPRSGMLKILR